MMLDAFTAIVAAGILCTCFSGAMLLVWRFLFPKRALLLWGIGIGCFATAALPIALRPFLPVYITITAQNQIFLLGYCFLWWGAASYRNLPPRTVPMLALSFSFFLLLAWFTYGNPLISMRIVTLQLYGVIFLICIIRTLLSTPARLTRMEKTTVAALLLDMAMLTVTIVAQIIYADYNEPIFRNVISSCYSMLSLITVTSFGLSFFLMILEQMFNEARRAEADSRSAKELLETIINHIPSLTYLKDREGRLLTCSQGLADLFGVTREQAIGKGSHDFFPAAVADRQHNDDLTVLQAGRVVKTEECIESSDGLHYYETIKLPVRAHDGQITSLCGISTDITERKLAEKALNETNERFMKLLDTIPTVAVQGYELDGTVIYWNKASETLFGYRSDEALEANLLELTIPPEMREEFQQGIQQMKETGVPLSAGELSLLRKDGSLVPVHSSYALIQTGGSRPVLFCMNFDLSERLRLEERLQHASEEWRKTFDAIPDMITILDSEHRILRSNRATWQRLGCDNIQDLLGKPCYTLFHGLDSPPETCPHARLMKDGVAHSAEVFEPKLNGYLDVTVTPLYDHNGKLSGSIHVAHDITGLKQGEEILQASEEKFRLLFEKSNDAIFITVPDGKVISANPEACRMFGMSVEEFAQADRSAVIDPSDDRFEAALECRTRTGEFNGELNFVRKNGQVFHADVSSSIFSDSSGNSRATVRIRDISERKRLEEELLNSEERYRMIFNEALIGICMADAETGIITDCNQALADLVGKPVDKLIGSHQTSLHPAPECNRPYSTTFLQHKNELAGHVLRDRLITSTGEIKEVEIKGRTAVIRNRRVVLGTFYDITERMQAEEELRKKNAEIEQFIYTVSHDLRSPLVTVKTFLGYLELDISTNDNERIAKDMGYMHTAADRMEVLLNELLDMSRIGRANTPHETVTLQELAGEAMDALAGQIDAGRVDMQVSRTNLSLCGDRRRLLQIWQNLLDNALKYMGNQTEPRIEIGIEQQHGETVFSVCDNGIGIAPQFQERIFGIFEQLDRNTSGVGMGLTMVKRIVEMYDGRIWVESGGGGTGSCFHFTLPGCLLTVKAE